MKYLFFIALALVTSAPVLMFAQEPGVKTFQSIPGLENVGNLTTQQYIDALYVIAITAASILAVFKLIWAGVQYMLSEVVTSKQKAKQDIQGALLGLLLILGAVTLLNTINPNLTNIDIFRNAKTVVPQQRNTSESRTSNNSGLNSLTGMNADGTCPSGTSLVQEPYDDLGNTRPACR